MSDMTWVFKLLTSISLSLIVMGCASHPPKVDCEGKLRPINPPAPVAHRDDSRHEG